MGQIPVRVRLVLACVLLIGVPVRVTLRTHDGREIPVREAWGSEELQERSREVLLTILDRINSPQ